MKPDGGGTAAQRRADQLLAEYQLRVERGERIDREQFLRQHPEAADRLRAYFAASEAPPQAIIATQADGGSPPGPRAPGEALTELHGLPRDSTGHLDAQGTVTEPASTARPFQSGVPGYDIVREIGRGGMGVVFEAIQKGKDRRVALKLVMPSPETAARTMQLFLRETSILSQLKHKRIVEFYELGMAGDQIFMAMEYVDAIDVPQYLAQRPRDVQIGYYCGIICQVLDALRYAHEQGLVHRDIKPKNILVSRHGRKLRTKVADFGLAKHYDTAGFSELTFDGEARGTFTFMAPEQFINSRYANPSCDIYSVGATLYYYLAGDYPYDFSRARNAYELSRIVRDGEPISLRDRRPEAPEKLSAIIQKALAKDPEARFASAAQMYAALFPFAKRSGA